MGLGTRSRTSSLQELLLVSLRSEIIMTCLDSQLSVVTRGYRRHEQVWGGKEPN